MMCDRMPAELTRSRHARRPAVGPALLAFGLTSAAGCASTMALDTAVIAYDRTVADSVAKQLLLNIARARQNLPMHFTAISSIAATYRFSVTAGVGPALTGERGGLLLPVIGGSAEENPTISIAPMQGDEFTERLLTPFEEQRLTLLLRQGYDVDSLLRLLGAELRLEGSSPQEVTLHTNRPSDREGYQVFRRVVAHLSSIQDRHALRVEPLHFHHTWRLPAAAVTPETYSATYRDFSVTLEPDGRHYRIAGRVNGRLMITNFDPDVLPNEERRRMHELAELAPANDVLVDIRPDFPGGEYPIRGRLRLRSFHEVLTFVGRSIEEEPEFAVEPDARTPPLRENPVRTLAVDETSHGRKDAHLSVELRGLHYVVQPETGYQWNRKAFSLLYQLFQMSISPVQNTGPAITIAK